MRFLYYTGQDQVPQSVTHVAFIDSSITEIPEEMFSDCRYLKEVELPEGIKLIGKKAFDGCWKLKKINIPSTVEVIGESAFGSCWKLQLKDEIPQSIQVIQEKAFSICISIKNARIPPSLSRIKKWFSNCQRLISFEMSEIIDAIDTGAFVTCWKLRNVAIPSDAEIGEGPFKECRDLIQIFPIEKECIHALKHRFDELPIHKLCYYQTYHPLKNSLQWLEQELASDAVYQRQDCLGMTPLHILALSKQPNIELIQAIVRKSPTDLITKDKWGDYPIDYACWIDAPVEILRILLETHRTKYLFHELHWDKMIDNLCSSQAPVEKFQLLLETYRRFFLGQALDWDSIINYYNIHGAPSVVLGYFIHSKIAGRLNSVGFEAWQMEVLNIIDRLPEGGDWEEDHMFEDRRELSIENVYSALEKFELKERMSQLELGVWKIFLDKARSEDQGSLDVIDQAEYRKSCRIKCGTGIILPNVLSFLYCEEDD
jgi:hypothetical protein